MNELISEGRLVLSKYKIAGRWNSIFEIQALCPTVPQVIEGPSNSCDSTSNHESTEFLKEFLMTHHASHETHRNCMEKHEMHRKEPKYMGWDEFGFDAKETSEGTQNPFKSGPVPSKAKARRDSMSQKSSHHRSQKPLEEWTVKDVAQEFQARMNDNLPMMSWNMYKSRFIQSLGDFRAANGTNAELELMIMRMFWANPYHWENCDGPEQIWKRFIKLAPGVIPEAHRRVTKIPFEVLEARLDKEWEAFYAEHEEYLSSRGVKHGKPAEEQDLVQRSQ